MSTSVHLGRGTGPPSIFEAWTYCIGNDWFIGARFDGSTAQPFDLSKQVGGHFSSGIIATQMLDIYPEAAPVIVVSTGTGYNWNTFDFFTVQRGQVAPFIGGVGYDGKFPVQLRDSGGFGDYYHFTCARRSNGAITLTQQQYGDPKGFHGPDGTPRTYVVTSSRYLARSGTKLSARNLRTERVPTAQLSFAPSKLC